MPASPGPTDWLSKIPGWLKAAIGLVGTIAAFIVAFRENWRLYTTVAVFLVLAYLFGVSLYILLKRRKLRSRQKKWEFVYARYRPLGLLGLVTACLVLTALVALQPTRQLALEGLLGTPTASPPPRLASPDVLIAPFDAPPTYQVEHWLQESLQARLREYGLNNVTVHLAEEPIRTENQAQQAVNDTGSKVVIWGWYDSFGIQVKLFLSGGSQSGSLVPGTSVILLAGRDVPSADLAVLITEVLPEDVNFLSFFVIGHLEYLADDYQAGHRAFDAAMTQLPPPDRVTVQNQAVLHFFRARQMQGDGSPAADVICEYLKAVELDPGFAEAYNNLGLVISERIVAENLSFKSPACLTQLGLEGTMLEVPPVFFERALQANPNFTLARYNKYAYLWSSDLSWRNNPELIAEMEDIQRLDPGMIGPYIVLAVTKDENGDPAGAIQMYEAGIAVQPDLPFLHVNLGQLYLSHEQDETRAESEFLEALRLDPGHEEARLALGHLYYRQGRLGEASSELDRLILAEPRSFLGSLRQRDALVLRSTIAFLEDQPAQARDLLELALGKSYADVLIDFLLGMLYQHEGQNDLAAESFDAAAQDSESAQRSRAAWDIFASRCFDDETNVMPFSDWALTRFPASSCLPADPRERILAIYEILNERLFALREQPQAIFLGAACPYLFTEDPVTGEWEFETTILYQIVNREATQVRPLTQFHGRLLIRELEPEITYLNHLYVLAEMADGSFQTLAPDVDELQHADGEYIVLGRGDEIVVTLDDYPVTGEVKQWWVMATGYYTPLR